MTLPLKKNSHNSGNFPSRLSGASKAGRPSQSGRRRAASFVTSDDIVKEKELGVGGLKVMTDRFIDTDRIKRLGGRVNRGVERTYGGHLRVKTHRQLVKNKTDKSQAKLKKIELPKTKNLPDMEIG